MKWRKLVKESAKNRIKDIRKEMFRMCDEFGIDLLALDDMSEDKELVLEIIEDLIVNKKALTPEKTLVAALVLGGAL